MPNCQKCGMFCAEGSIHCVSCGAHLKPKTEPGGHFSDLVLDLKGHRANRLAMKDQFMDRPHKSSKQTLHEINLLSSKTEKLNPGNVSNKKVSAKLLHSSNGISLDFVQDVKFDWKPIVPSLTQSPAMSVEKFLDQEREKAFTDAVRDVQNKTSKNCHEKHFESILNDWETMGDRTSILDQLDILSSGPTYLAEATSQQPATGIHLGNQAMNIVLNFVQSEEENLNLTETFYQNSLADQRVESNTLIWKILNTLLLNTQSSTGADKKMYFWKRTLKYIEQNLNEIMASEGIQHWGSAEGQLERYRTFLHRKYSEKFQGAEPPKIWDQIYLAIRVGNLTDAVLLAVAELRQRNVFTVPPHLDGLSDEDLFLALQENCRKLSKEESHQDRHRQGGTRQEFELKDFVQEYLQLTTQHREITISDAFINYHSFNTEDWLWFKIQKILSEKEPTHREAEFKLFVDTQINMVENESGATYWSAEDPEFFLMMLLWTGQFRAAVKHCVDSNLLSLAAHMVLCMKYCGEDLEPLLADEIDDSFLVTVIFKFVRSFPTQFNGGFEYTEYALAYYSLLNKDQYVAQITEMLLKTNYEQWSAILGGSERDAPRGIVAYTRILRRSYNGKVSLLLNDIGQEAERLGHIQIALFIYNWEGPEEIDPRHFYERQLKKIDLLNQIISQDVFLRPQTFETKEWPCVDIARLILTKRDDARFPVGDDFRLKEKRDTLNILLQLVDFNITFSKILKGKTETSWDEAWDIIRASNPSWKTLSYYIPLGSDISVTACVNEFSQMPQEILRNLPNILLKIMKCLCQRYEAEKALNKNFRQKELYAEGGHRKSLEEIIQCGEYLVTYTGSIPYRFSSYCTADLTQMQAKLI